MNLISSAGDDLSKKYVANLMSKNKLETSFRKKKKLRLKINAKIFIYSFFGFFALIGPFSLMSGKYIANADNIPAAPTVHVNYALNSVTNENVLQPKEKKNAISSYTVGDMRVVALKQYLSMQDSKLQNYADVFVSQADANNLDYRLLASISGAESGFCKYPTLTADNSYSYNCWGWGKSGKYFSQFKSFPEAITHISKGISNVYGPNPTPKKMQNMYCQSCIGSSNWQDTINTYMQEIEQIRNRL